MSLPLQHLPDCQIHRLGHEAYTALGSAEVDLIRVNAACERAAWELFKECKGKNYSFTDCPSLVLVRRRLGIRRALAPDVEFRQEGFETLLEQ